MFFDYHDFKHLTAIPSLPTDIVKFPSIPRDVLTNPVILQLLLSTRQIRKKHGILEFSRFAFYLRSYFK